MLNVFLGAGHRYEKKGRQAPSPQSKQLEYNTSLSSEAYQTLLLDIHPLLILFLSLLPFEIFAKSQR